MRRGEKVKELRRLAKAFGREADKFHEITLSTYFVTQEGASCDDRRFARKNHGIVLWQFYGSLESEIDERRMATNLVESNLQWGMRGAKLSQFAILEGSKVDLFVRMATRAANALTKEERETVRSRVLKEIFKKERESNSSLKPVGMTNGSSLSIWLNYLLFHLSMTNSGREGLSRIEPDPFTLSLIAIERLLEGGEIQKSDRSRTPVDGIAFKIAVSFAGEHRSYVSSVVDGLKAELQEDDVFYDFDYQAQLARPNLDQLLLRIYREQSDLIVVFLAEEYEQKEWCGLEWRAIRDIIKSKDDSKVMFVRMDNAKIDGVFSIDGYIDGIQTPPETLVRYILERLATNA